MESNSKFQNPRTFFRVESRIWPLESGIQHQESGISLTAGIRNPISTDWKKQSGIHGSATVLDYYG